MLNRSPICNKVMTSVGIEFDRFRNHFLFVWSKEKNTAIHEFIKDVESDLALKRSEKQTFIRNMAISHFYKFLKSTPPLDPHVKKLAHLHNVTKRYLQNNPNIIFTKADKGNITVALDKRSYIEKVEELLKDTNTYYP